MGSDIIMDNRGSCHSECSDPRSGYPHTTVLLTIQIFSDILNLRSDEILQGILFQSRNRPLIVLICGAMNKISDAISGMDSDDWYFFNWKVEQRYWYLFGQETKLTLHLYTPFAAMF